MSKSSRKNPTYPNIDLTIPIIKTDYAEAGCFGKEWDIGTTECSNCADKDICGIIFSDLVNAKAKKIEKENGTKFLDVQDFDALTTSILFEFIASGVTTVKELVAFCMEKANTSDKVAVVNWLKRWLKSEASVYTKNSIVWKR